MKNQWFKKAGWLYIPSSWEGIIVCLALALFCVHIFLFVDADSHSASDTLYGVFPFIVPAFLLYLRIGKRGVVDPLFLER